MERIFSQPKYITESAKVEIEGNFNVLKVLIFSKLSSVTKVFCPNPRIGKQSNINSSFFIYFTTLLSERIIAFGIILTTMREATNLSLEFTYSLGNLIESR